MTGQMAFLDSTAFNVPAARATHQRQGARFRTTSGPPVACRLVATARHNDRFRRLSMWWMDTEETNDPRRVIALLDGRDKLLSGRRWKLMG